MYLYILHEILHFIQDELLLDQLRVEVCIMISHVPEKTDGNGYISVSILEFSQHSKLTHLSAN